MNYEEFKERLTEDLKQDLYERTGNEHFVNETNVNKLQNASYEALTIRPENSPIAVSLDVQSLFKEYEGGRGHDEIRDWAIDIVSKGFANQPQFNIDDFTNYDVMKEKLAIQVVSTERNAGTRVIPMDEEVYQCFKRIIANRKAPKVEPIVDGYTGFLFLDKNGKPMVALHWEKYMEHIVEKPTVFIRYRCLR